MGIADVIVFIRNVRRNKFCLTITLGGFTLALTFAILLSVYVYQEWSIDRFHVNKDRIFRMSSENGAYFYPTLGDFVKNEHPEIEAYTRLYDMEGFSVNPDGEKIRLRVLFADSTFFHIFSFKTLEGDRSTMLSTLKEAVLSRSFARRLYGERSAMGQTLVLNGDSFVVTGVMEDFTETHINECDVLVNIESLPLHKMDLVGSFGLYFLTRSGMDLNTKKAEIFETLKKNCSAFQKGFYKDLYFQPLTQIYLDKIPGKAAHYGDPTLIGILAFVIFLILGLAVINYINLTIAQAGFRAKEVAVKRLLGIDNKMLYKQFIGEAVMLLGMAFALALLLSVLIEPLFNTLLGVSVDWTAHFTFGSALVILAFIGVLGGVAGGIPAFVITRFKSLEIVKGMFRVKSKNVYAKVLISFQYVVAVVLIILTFAGIKQADFLRNYNLGFNKENVIWLSSLIDASEKQALRDELCRIPGVQAVSYAQGTPMDAGNSRAMEFEEKLIDFRCFKVDSSFFSLLGLKVEPTDVSDPKGVVINKKTIQELGLDDLPHSLCLKGGRTIPVVGVVNDFHIRSLERPMECEMISPMEAETIPWKILVKIKTSDPAGVYKQIKDCYAEFCNGFPFYSNFMDETLAQQYESNERTAKLIGYFSILAIVLAMMGSFAMITYFILQKIKEIGIRRVNGASIREICSSLLTDFMKWVVLAFVVACPIAWLAVQRWLSEFVCRIDLSWWLFALAGLMIFLTALAVVSGQCWMAARRNPVESLKSE